MENQDPNQEDQGGGDTGYVGWEIQDPRTGQWLPYPANDNGRGNIRFLGVTYSHDTGAQYYAQQHPTQANNPPPTPPPPPTTPPPPNTQPPPPPNNPPPGATPPGQYPSTEFTPPAPSWDMGPWAADAPVFTPPIFRQPPAFEEPDYEASLKDPGYMFEANEGRRRLESSAAARGVLNGGGTLKDINAWGQNFATTRVKDVGDRARQDYMLNYATQYVDPYKYAYQAALDAFTGRNSQWQTRGQIGQRQNEIDWLHAYTPFNDAWSRRLQIALA